METLPQNSGIPIGAETLRLPAPPRPQPLGMKHVHGGKVGMAAFLLTEVAFFGTLIMAYVAYLPLIRESKPSPAEVFDMNMVLGATLCLWTSSATVHLATGALRRGTLTGFRLWWGLTILLGVAFLIGTGFEWHDLIVRWKLIWSTNMFGTCYFTLVGFHAFHVTIGLLLLTTLWLFSLGGTALTEQPLNAELVSWYWHFVDGVWVAVFSVVYLVSRY